MKSFVAVFLLSTQLAPAQQYGWQVIARPNTRGLFTMDFVDTLHGWCAGRDTIYRTADGGKSWRGSSLTSGGYVWRGLSFSDTLHGWAAGVDANSIGVIWRTTNGGVTWIEQQFIFDRVYSGTFSHSAVRNTTSGYLHYTIDTGLVVSTTNAGTNWQEQRFDSIRQLRKVLFVDSLHGWITGYDSSALVLRTNNGGITWGRFSSPLFFNAIDFIDTLRGWAGTANAFYGTTDGGMRWQFLYEVPFLEEFFMEDISFVDSINGWAFGSSAEPGPITEAIYRTTNGGVSWYRESIGLTSDLGGLGDGIMLDRFHGWAVAADGRVLAYRPVTSVIEKLLGVPKSFVLHQNYPNPFNPTTTIEYELSRRSGVKLTVHDLLGRTVKTLVDQMQDAGIYRIVFDASGLATGAYFYTLETPEYKETKQLLFTK
jgi:photosystem II stability/assembly factor-like uncharacterized protein